MSASPPKSRMVDTASSAHRRISLARSSSADTVGISTNWRRAASKRARSLFANATSEFLSIMGAHSIGGGEGRRQDHQRQRRLRKARQDPPHLHRQRALILQVEV